MAVPSARVRSQHFLKCRRPDGRESDFVGLRSPSVSTYAHLQAMSNQETVHYLIPTNFGIASQIARRAAIGWAARSNGTRITLLHVAPPAPETRTGFDAIGLLHTASNYPTIEQVRRAQLEQLKTELHPELSACIDLRIAWRSGDLLEEIAQFVRAESVDAIVLAAGCSYFPWRVSLGSRLARKSICQVILVHASARAPQNLKSRLTASKYIRHLVPSLSALVTPLRRCLPSRRLTTRERPAFEATCSER